MSAPERRVEIDFFTLFTPLFALWLINLLVVGILAFVGWTYIGQQQAKQAREFRELIQQVERIQRNEYSSLPTDRR